MGSGTKLSAITVALLLTVAIECAGGQSSQSSPQAVPEWQTAAGGKMKFEVASVRPSAPGTPFSASVSLNALDGAAPQGSLFRANCILMPYLVFAYKISDTNQARSIWDNLPEWAKTQFYSVEARSEAPPTRDQLRLMVQALLADRFKLAIHREMQQLDEYALVLDKPGNLGPQLHAHPADEPCANDPNTSTMIEAPAKGSETPRWCGMKDWPVDGQEHVRMTDVTMAQAANYLSAMSMAGGNRTPHSGLDGTGLKGRFDLDIQFMVEVNGPGSNPEGSGPTFSSALKNQLGLKLVERKGPVEIVVIDHLEKPSEN
jgi:uncharacterized protein (TIGR03435 family)